MGDCTALPVDVGSKLVVRAGKLLKRYGERMGLQGWSIAVATESQEEMEHDHGEATVMTTENVRPGSKAAEIFINRDFDYDTSHVFNFGQTFLHELAHVVLIDVGYNYMEAVPNSEHACCNDRHVLAGEINERLCDRIANAVYEGE